ncbi:MAG: Ycf66 family protein [Pleurocapsa sp. MO_226.B13]|nr:Ycf66 family protein [Pleurocapsa sp. MO_226.B13]
MLSYALAIAVASCSLVLFSTAFFMSDIHSQDDFLWSGVGLFYALVLWYCARNITGAVLLGQAAVTTLLVSYSWQTLKLRKAVANSPEAEGIDSFSLLKAISSLLKRNQPQSQPEATNPPTTISPKVTETEIAIPDETATDDASPESASQTPDSQDDPQTTVISETKVDTKTIAEPKTETTDVQPAIAEQITNPEAKVTVEVVEKEPVKTESSELDDTRDAVEGDRVVEKVENSSPQVVEPIGTTEEAKEAKDQSEESKTEIPSEPETAFVDVEKAENSSPQVVEQIGTTEEAKDPSEKSKTEIPSEPETAAVDAEPANAIASENQEQPNISLDDSESESTTNSHEIKTEVRSTTVETKVDTLDSLETVEVAEVLEALPEDLSANRNRDRENIIEVTSTQIDITTEQIDPNSKEE